MQSLKEFTVKQVHGGYVVTILSHGEETWDDTQSVATKPAQVVKAIKAWMKNDSPEVEIKSNEEAVSQLRI